MNGYGRLLAMAAEVFDECGQVWSHDARGPQRALFSRWGGTA